MRLENRGEELPEPVERLLGRLEEVADTPAHRVNDVTVQRLVEQSLLASEATIDRRSLQLKGRFEITDRHIVHTISPEKVRGASQDVIIIIKLAGPAHLTKIAPATKLTE